MPGLPIRAVTCNSCYGGVRLVVPWQLNLPIHVHTNDHLFFSCFSTYVQEALFHSRFANFVFLLARKACDLSCWSNGGKSRQANYSGTALLNRKVCELLSGTLVNWIGRVLTQIAFKSDTSDSSLPCSMDIFLPPQKWTLQNH